MTTTIKLTIEVPDTEDDIEAIEMTELFMEHVGFEQAFLSVFPEDAKVTCHGAVKEE